MAAGVLTLLLLGAALALIAIGAAAAFTAGNALKRVIALAAAQGGAALGALALGAPESLAIAGLAAMFGAFVLGSAIVVRLQEAYGAIEIEDLDAADLAAEPADEAQ